MSLALYNCRRIIYTNCRRFSVSGFSINNVTKGFTKFKEFRMNPSVSRDIRFLPIRRCLSTQPDPDSNNKPVRISVSEHPPVAWPGFFQMLRCWLTYKFALVMLDKDFDLSEFIDGSQNAVCIVSSALSREDYDSLDGLVTPEVIDKLKKNISKMSEDEKREIELHEKELVVAFPCNINTRPGSDGLSKIVEICMVYHFVRNWEQPDDPHNPTLRHKVEKIQHVLSSPGYEDNAIICNYRFIRKLGAADKSWVIDAARQFKLRDLQE